MKAVIVNGSNQIYFRNLTSEEVYQKIGSTGVLSVGVVDENGVAMGIVVTELDGEQMAQLLWIYVAEERRREGAGTFLYETIAQGVASRGYKKLFSVFRDEEDMDDVLYFLMMQMNTMFVPVTEDVVVIPASGLNEKLESAHVSGSTCLEYRRIPSFSIKNLLQEMSEEEKQKAGVIPGANADSSKYNDCSCGILGEKELEGLFMVQNTKDEKKYILDYFISQGGDAKKLLKMLKFSSEKMLEASQDAELTVATLNGFGKVVKSMIGDQARNVVYTGAVTALA